MSYIYPLEAERISFVVKVFPVLLICCVIYIDNKIKLFT